RDVPYAAQPAVGTEHSGYLGGGLALGEPVPGVRDDGGVAEREGCGSRLVGSQPGVAPADDVQHSPIGLDHVELEVALDETIGQLPRPRTDLGNARSVLRYKPVHGS